MNVMTRRDALRAGAATIGGAALLGATGAACAASDPEAAPAGGTAAATGAARGMPAESTRHELTYMAWPSKEIWGRDVQAARSDIAGVARAIADFEPVTLLAGPADVAAAQKACGQDVEVVPIPVDDLWIRDSGPTFVREGGIDFGFNGWGGKQRHERDALVARRVLERAGVRRIAAPIIAEGGSLEIDGAGTLMATESSLVNANRNPGRTRDQIEGVLKNLLGVTKVIWFDGVKGEDITDCHVDALARFAEPGTVVISKPPPGTPPVWQRVYDQARGVLRDATDARGKSLEVVELPEPVDVGRRGEDFLGTYINYYVFNDGVILPKFGDRAADRRAASIARDLHPGREVVQVSIDMVAEGGGGIHCATQQRPAMASRAATGSSG